MAQESIMSLLFGKKKARRTTKKTTGKKSTKVVRPKALTAAVRKEARKFKVKTRLMCGSKHVGYRKVSLIKRDIRKKKKTALKKKQAAAKKAGKPVRRRRVKSSAFGAGAGGSYMPLSSFMSPFPYSVSGSPAWI